MASHGYEKQPEDVVSELISAVESGKYDAVKSILHGQGHNFPVKDILNTVNKWPSCVIQNFMLEFTVRHTALTQACYNANNMISDTGRLEGQNLIPLHMAVEKRNHALARVLLEGKALVDQADTDGRSALHICAIPKSPYQKPDLEILDILIQHKADVNLQDNRGETPLHTCFHHAYKQHDMIRLLLDNGASANIPNNNGKCPLHLAHPIDFMEILLEYKVSVNQTNHDGQSALHFCCKYSMNIESLTTLISHKADVNLQDKNGQTPLHLSSTSYNRDLTTTLLANGASASLQDNLGNSPLHLAVKESKMIITEKLLDSGVSVNQTNYDGQSPLHLCSSAQIAATLISYKADVNLQDKKGQMPLHMSLKNHKWDVTMTFLENGASVSTPDSNGDWPLLKAVEFCKASLVTKMLECNAPVNQIDDGGQSALHVCCHKSWNTEPCLEILTTLIKYKADVNLQDKNGNTPLHLSLENHECEMAMALLENGALPTIQNTAQKSPLHMAVKYEDISLVRRMLQNEPSVNQITHDGQSALHILCCDRYSSIELLNILISCKADVNLQDKDGKTPLHVSLENHNLNVAMALLENGALITIPDSNGEWPLHMAVRSGDISIVRNMLERKAPVNQTNQDGKSALHMSVNCWRSEMENLSLLISYKANVNLQDKNDKTPLHISCAGLNISCAGLHISCAGKQYDMARALLENGASANIPDNAGELPLHVAVHGGEISLVELLLEFKATVNQTNYDGKSPLHFFCFDRWPQFPYGYKKPNNRILEILVKHKADVNLQDKDGKTPLHISLASYASSDLTKVLMEDGSSMDLREVVFEDELPCCDMVMVLLENHAMASIQDNNGECPLQMAVKYGYTFVVRKMLDGKASVNQTNHDGQSALHVFCNGSWRYNFDLEMLDTLISHEADLNLQDKKGNTALHVSITTYPGSTSTQEQFGDIPLHFTIIEKLLDAGASMNQTNCDGQSPLHLCSMHHHKFISNVAAKLISCKADINIQDNNGKTPLHLNMANPLCGKEVATILISNEAVVNLQDKNGETPLHVSCEMEPSLVHALLLKGAKVNKRDTNGQSSLHKLCKASEGHRGTLFILSELMKYNADVNLQDKNGQTPMHLCCSRKDCDLMMTLLENGALGTIQDHKGKCPMNMYLALNKPDQKVMLRMVNLCSNRQNENMEVICNTYELIALRMVYPESFECMHKATLLRIENNIPKRTLEPMECYGFCKEWVTIEELETYGKDANQLKLQAILAKERIQQGQNEKLSEMVRDDLISAVLAASKSKAGVLLEHHLNIWSSCKLEGDGSSSWDNDGHGSSYLDVMLAWENEFDEHFESYDTIYIVKLIQTTAGILLEHSVNISGGFLSMLITLIMKLYRRNRQVENTSKNELMLAKELLQQLLDTEEDGNACLQHQISKLNFSFLKMERGTTQHSSHISCDYELMKMLLESRIQTNAVDSSGDTILHSAMCSFRNCLYESKYRYGFYQYKFSQEVADQLIKTIRLLLDKGVYPNAQNKHYKTARDILGCMSYDDDAYKRDDEYGHVSGLEVSRRIDDLLKQYEDIHSMTLKHMAAVVVKTSRLSFENILPNALVRFVNLHRPNRSDCSLRLRDIIRKALNTVL